MAFQFWRLNDELKKLNRPYYVVGDSAYTLSLTVMTPFTKRDLQNPHTVAERDNYNFFLSQLRIRIEMAIGILVNKWRVFKTPIHFDISKCHKIITSTIRLHNYVINRKIIEKKGHFNPEHEEMEVLQTYNGGTNQPDSGDPDEEDENTIEINQTDRDISLRKHQMLVDHIKYHNMRRPPQVIPRKNQS